MHYCPCENGEYKKYTKKQRAKYNDNVPKYYFQNYKWWQSSVKNYFLSFRQLSHFPNNYFFSSCIVLKIPTSLKQRNRTFFSVSFSFRPILGQQLFSLWYPPSLLNHLHFLSERCHQLFEVIVNECLSMWWSLNQMWKLVWHLLYHQCTARFPSGISKFYVLCRFLVIFDFFLFWFQSYHFRKPCSSDTFISACLLNSAPILFNTVTVMFACPIRPLNWR